MFDKLGTVDRERLFDDWDGSDKERCGELTMQISSRIYTRR